MKSLLLAGTLSLTLHGALLLVKIDSEGQPPPRPEPQVISMALVAPEETRPTAAPGTPPAVKQEARVKAMPAVRPASPPRPAPPKKTEEKQPVVAVATEEAAEQPAPGLAEPARQQSGEEAQPGGLTCTAALPAAGPPGGGGTEKPDSGATPLYRQNPPPDYPQLARRRGQEGTVQVDVLVNSRGGVNEVRLAETSGHDLLDRAALATVQSWLFQPGKKGEETIDMWVRVPIRFALHD